MSALIFNSGLLIKRLTADLQAETTRFHQRLGRGARLSQLLVGHDPAAEVYSRQLVRACRLIGLGCTTLTYPFEISEQELRAEVEHQSNHSTTDGVVVILPLPSHIHQRTVTDVLSPEKDVDGLSSRNAGNLVLGFPSFIPSTADAVLAVLQEAQISIDGKNAVVVGRSNVGGKPIALTLMQQNATVTICHSRTVGLEEITRAADILVVSTGRPHSVTARMVKPGAIVLDAGINTLDGQVVGDVDGASVIPQASFLTPVPGGLGPLTHLMLIRHTLLGPQ